MPGLPIKTFDEIVSEFNAKLDDFGSQITNRQSGGAYDLVIRVFSLMLSDCYTLLENSIGQGFTGTATGDFLDLKAAEVGLTRLGATKAIKEFKLTRTNTSGVLLINIGDAIKTPILPNRGKLRWFTIESDDPALVGFAGQFDDGVGEITIPFEADEAGSEFNNMEELLGRTGEEITMEIEAGLSGVDAVLSTGDDMDPGTDAETDEQLRARIIARWSELALGATRLSYINFAKGADPKIVQANAFKGAGPTDVRIILSGSPGDRDLSGAIGLKVYPDDNFDSLYTDDGTPGGDERALGITVHQYVRDRAPLTDFIILSSVTEIPSNITVRISPADGYVYADLEDLVETRLRALFLVEKSVTDVTPLDVGQALRFSEITRILNETPGIEDFKIDTPDQNGIPCNADQALSLGVITITEL
jgi:uncharacterized phage protein gp47/JayE